MDNSIQELMKDEHKRIILILEDLEKLVKKDINSAKNEFSKFKWALEKHLFIEEKAIFSVSSRLVNEEVSYVFDLLQEHGVILELVNNIENSLVKNVAPNIRGFAIVLKRHAEFEDAYFYPRLDELLPLEQQQRIIERIKEIVRG